MMGSLPPSRRPIRVAVLECDEPVGPVKEKFGSYGTMFKRLLERGAKKAAQTDGTEEVELDVTDFDVVHNEHYPALDSVDAVLITGSKYNSFDNDPWILRLVEYTKQALAHDRVRVIGVCFGHQIVGRAMDVEVGRNTQGWEIAVVPHHLTEKGRQIFGVEQLHLHQMHQDIVFKWPPNVEHLAYTPRCDVQAMYIPKRVISVQGHPEFNAEIVTEIAQRRHAQGIFDETLYEDAMSRVNGKHDGDAVAAAFIRFLLEE